VSGPSLSDGRVRTDEVIFAENESRKVFPAGALHSADLARTQDSKSSECEATRPASTRARGASESVEEGRQNGKSLKLGELVN